MSLSDEASLLYKTVSSWWGFAFGILSVVVTIAFIQFLVSIYLESFFVLIAILALNVLGLWLAIQVDKRF